MYGYFLRCQILIDLLDVSLYFRLVVFLLSGAADYEMRCAKVPYNYLSRAQLIWYIHVPVEQSHSYFRMLLCGDFYQSNNLN